MNRLSGWSGFSPWIQSVPLISGLGFASSCGHSIHFDLLWTSCLLGTVETTICIVIYISVHLALWIWVCAKCVTVALCNQLHNVILRLSHIALPSVTILQSGLDLYMYQWAFGRGPLHRVNHNLHMYQWAPLGDDRCVGEWSRRIRNSPKVSRRNWRFLGVSRRMLLESVGRIGYLIYRSGRYSSCLIDHPLLWEGSSIVTSLIGILCGEHSLSVPFLNPVKVAVVFVWLRIIPNVAATCAMRPGDRRYILSFPRSEYSRNDHATPSNILLTPLKFNVCAHSTIRQHLPTKLIYMNMVLKFRLSAP